MTESTQAHEHRWPRAGFWRQRRVLLSALAGVDALVVLLGTFIVWLVLGFADMDLEVAAWISPSAVALGLATVATTLLVARGALRQRPRTPLIVIAVCLHLGLALATAVAIGSVLGTAILLAGAGVTWMARTSRSADPR